MRSHLPVRHWAPSVLAACAMFASPSVFAADVQPRVIRASGEAVVKVAPDRACITVSVTVRASTARQASETNARISTTVLEKLRAAVRAPGEVSTSGYDLTAEYDYNQNGGVARTPRLVGYVATNRFSIVTADLPGVGAVIDAAIAAGADQVDSIRFFLDDEDSARHKALLAAGGKARAEATTIAESLGVVLGEVLDASSTGGAVPMPAYGREMAMPKMAVTAANTEVVPGSVEISASVTATFAIR